MILIKNAILLTLQDDKIVNDAQIEIENGIIRHAGVARNVNEEVESVIDASNHLVMPGFVNAHTHLAMTLMRGIADDVSLSTWLNDFIFPIEDKMTEDEAYYGTLLALIESIKTGSTTVSDLYMFPDVSLRAISESGLRANIGVNYASKPLILDSLILNNVEKSFKRLNKLADDRIIFSLAPHSPYTCSVEILEQTPKLANDLNALVQIHIHETKKEVGDYIRTFGKTPIEKLDEIGFFESNTLAAHCVWLNDNDLDILKKRGVNVVLNPQSNLKLGSGIPPLQKLIEHHIPLSIGTDGASSNNNLAVLEDMRLASLLAKGSSLNPELLNALEVIRMATVNGAKALGFSDVGLIKEGYRADLIFINISKANLTPLTNPISLVAYSMYPEDVDTVMVAGKLIMKDRVILTMDEEFVRKKANEKFKKLSYFINNNKKHSAFH
jgi:5-methylthioadenosine/S-adenosylhomocysteine deaminase